MSTDPLVPPGVEPSNRPPPAARLLSLLIPVYNEQDNVLPLHAALAAVLGRLGRPYEILFIDDGSTDATAERLAEAAGADPAVRIVALWRHSGQTAALSAGIDAARGAVLVPLDGDLQNDPADIPRLLAKLDEGYSVVSGWRRRRRDPFWSRRLPSIIANRLISRISGVALHDYGCTLKAYRRECLQGVRLYGEMHRFVPIFAAWQGARVAEIEVNHRPRIHGRSKYGISRTVGVVLDLIVIKFLQVYAQKPIHLFGGFGLLSITAALPTFILMLAFKAIKLAGPARLSPALVRNFGKDFVETPLPELVVLFFLTGVLSILMGLLAEMIMRTYYESQDKRTYLVKEPAGPADRRPDPVDGGARPASPARPPAAPG